MKFKHILTAAALMLSIGAIAQPPMPKPEDKEEGEGFKFTTVKELPVTSVKDQNQAGTCWCYSTLAFFEAELLRMGKPEYDFSEMYIVYKTYLDRAEAAVRTHGDVSFSQGGSFGDVIYAIKNYGLVPDELMPAGAMHGDSLSNFTELSAVTEPYVAGVIKSRKIQMDKDGNPLWKKGLAGIYDAYLGVPPTEFTYNGKKYTPKSFAESTGLNMNDYVNLTSFTHHPFYEPFVIEVQDNWRWGQALNLPIDELMQVMDNAIANGYPIAWGSDVSEAGWLRGKMAGVAVLPDIDAKGRDLHGSDMAHWLGMSAADRKKEAQNGPTPQKWVTQKERQIAYDNYETGDDHGMLIYCTAKDQMGNEYYIVKYSWGDAGQYKGIWYVSKAFARYKTLNIIVHKDALPKDIAKKLGIK